MSLRFSQFTTISFDCYGTLIDWELGLITAIRSVLGNRGQNVSDERLLQLYAAAETQFESQSYRTYREVMSDSLAQVCGKFALQLSRETIGEFPETIRNWPPFDDTVAALRTLRKRFRLVILSNIDNDLFGYSAAKLGVEFDHLFTAEQIRSYKPKRKNFEYLLEHGGAGRRQILHVAQSLFHDIRPAKSLGIATAWVNRRHDKPGSGATPAAEAKPDMEVADLQTLASAIEAELGA